VTSGQALHLIYFWTIKLLDEAPQLWPVHDKQIELIKQCKVVKVEVQHSIQKGGRSNQTHVSPPCVTRQGTSEAYAQHH
jgi:hypothetical protein